VQVDISDVRGRLVQRILDEHRDAGSHTVVWDGRDRHGRTASTGVYFYRVAGGRSAATGRVLLLR
jgi:flagellar hook assembly protein FlgD